MIAILLSEPDVMMVSVGSHRVRSMYRFQPYVIVVTAFKNGCRDTFARITAPNIKIVSTDTG